MIPTIPPHDDMRRVKIIGRDQGYSGLAIFFGTEIDGPSGLETPMLRTAWEPTAKELAALNAGASIVIEIINVINHPPIKVMVSDVPEKVG